MVNARNPPLPTYMRVVLVLGRRRRIDVVKLRVIALRGVELRMEVVVGTETGRWGSHTTRDFEVVVPLPPFEILAEDGVVRLVRPPNHALQLARVRLGSGVEKRRDKVDLSRIHRSPAQSCDDVPARSNTVHEGSQSAGVAL